MADVAVTVECFGAGQVEKTARALAILRRGMTAINQEFDT